MSGISLLLVPAGYSAGRDRHCLCFHQVCIPYIVNQRSRSPERKHQSKIGLFGVEVRADKGSPFKGHLERGGQGQPKACSLKGLEGKPGSVSLSWRDTGAPSKGRAGGN